MFNSPRVNVTNVEMRSMQTPKGKSGKYRSGSRSSSGARQSWYSPRSNKSVGQNAAAASSNNSAFLQVPKMHNNRNNMADCFTTPQHKESTFHDQSNPERFARIQKVLQAPAKRSDNYYEESRSDLSGQGSGRHRDRISEDSLSVKEFKLDCSSNGGNSTNGSSPQGNDRQGVSLRDLDELRGQWSAFTQRINEV